MTPGWKRVRHQGSLAFPEQHIHNLSGLLSSTQLHLRRPTRTLIPQLVLIWTLCVFHILLLFQGVSLWPEWRLPSKTNYSAPAFATFDRPRESLLNASTAGVRLWRGPARGRIRQVKCEIKQWMRPCSSAVVEKGTETVNSSRNIKPLDFNEYEAETKSQMW